MQVKILVTIDCDDTETVDNVTSKVWASELIAGGLNFKITEALEVSEEMAVVPRKLSKLSPTEQRKLESFSAEIEILNTDVDFDIPSDTVEEIFAELVSHFEVV